MKRHIRMKNGKKEGPGAPDTVPSGSLYVRYPQNAQNNIKMVAYNLLFEKSFITAIPLKNKKITSSVLYNLTEH